MNAERLHAAATAAFDRLYEGEASASAALRSAMKHIEELSRFDGKFQDCAAALNSARITVEDMGATLRDYAGGINASPGRLAEVEDRLALIDRLKRKYGHTVEEITAYGQEIAAKLHEVENRDEAVKQLRRELAGAAAEYLQAARALSRQRLEAARKLERLVEGELSDLAMKARFKVEIGGSEEEANWGPTGFDEVAYLVSANPGEPMGPVEKIASGGELSRIMLALKVVAARAGGARKPQSPLATLVFDEIDTGIGGRAAESVGRKLKSLAQANQVLCITHLPQIASFADHHYVIEKQETGGRARTLVRRLDLAGRTHEVARLLSGAIVTDAALKNAAQMLKAGASSN